MMGRCGKMRGESSTACPMMNQHGDGKCQAATATEKDACPRGGGRMGHCGGMAGGTKDHDCHPDQGKQKEHAPTPQKAEATPS